jgi:diguanylate cyclase (GGDEF)-like protein
MTYAVVTAAFLVLERPGLGIGHFYYVPIALIALASGPLWGATAGTVATVLYSAGIIINPFLPSTLQFEETMIRLLTFASLGVLIGVFAQRNRALVDQLTRLADRDSITGLPNTRVFQDAIERRLAENVPFGLLVGDIDELRELNGQGREHGDEALRRLADRLLSTRRADDDVARVGGDEFAVLARLDGADARTLALRMEKAVRLSGQSVTFGWASFPQDGENALALYRAADERLYARKMAGGYRRDVIG